MSTRLRTGRLEIAVLVLVAAITLSSTISSPVRQAIHDDLLAHSLAHIVVFAGLAWLSSHRAKTNGLAIALCFATLVFAAGLEWIQHAIYAHALEWNDIRDDFIGITGALLLRIVHQ